MLTMNHTNDNELYVVEDENQPDDLIMQPMDVHEYVGKNAVRGSWASRLKYACRSKRVLCGGVVALFLLVLIVTLSTTLPNRNESSSSSSSANGPLMPPPEVPPNVLETNKNDMGTFLIQLYQAMNLTWTSLSVEGSPQYDALQWVAGREKYTVYTGAVRVQRYSLATLYYATYMKNHSYYTTAAGWSSENGWMSDDDECTWEGIACNSQKQVTAVLLPQHDLSGSLPVELAMLPELQQVDFTSNNIYMGGEFHKVWLHLSNLQILNMNDNFFVSTKGLPAEFVGLTSLQKMALSNTLLQGTMTDKVFQALSNLQYMEIESNYLSGAIPSALGKLPNLVYVYARGNLLTIQLSKMLVLNSYPALFSLWLDGNVVQGTIPTVIGTLTNLASLSVTNSSLTGPIPTEIGNLVNFQRVWLYSNKLVGSIPAQLSKLSKLEVFEIYNNSITGIMPSNVCQSVAASKYQYKALTADCSKVKCDQCCTTCYK